MTYLSITAKPIYNRRPSGFLQQKKRVELQYLIFEKLSKAENEKKS